MTKSQICVDITCRCPDVSVHARGRSLTHSLPPSRRSEERCFHTVDRLRLHALVRVPSFLLSKQRGRQSVARSVARCSLVAQKPFRPPSLPPSSFLPPSLGGSEAWRGQQREANEEMGIGERDGERERLWPPGPPPDMTSILTAEDYLGWMGREKNNLGSFACVAG